MAVHVACSTIGQPRRAVHCSDGFSGIFDPSNGDMVPLYREPDGFWYMYYVTAANSTEARKLISKGKLFKMLFDTGASASLIGTNDEREEYY